jgi:tetratricopeptide (TPR) repeat protein
MSRRASLLTPLFFTLFLLFPRVAAAAETEGVSWSAVEGEILRVLKRFSSEEALAPTAPLEKQADFYLRAGLWSLAEQLLRNAPQREAEPLLMKLHALQGRFDLIYATYQKEPSLFLNEPALLGPAGQGAFQKKSYSEVLTIVESISPSSPYAPYRYYLSALAFLALGDQSRFEETMAQWIQWGDRHPRSLWTLRGHLLNGYYHLGRKAYDLAFTSLGRLFGETPYADLAMLGVGWSYFELGAPENLVSILEGVEGENSERGHRDLLFQMLIRYQLSQGDRVGAIETVHRARVEAGERIGRLREKADQIQGGARSPSPISPPGSLLKQALTQLQEKVGQKPEITFILNKVDLLLRQQALSYLRGQEEAARKEEKKRSAELARHCITLQRTAGESGAETIDPLYREARAAALRGKKEEAASALKRLLEEAPTGPYSAEATYRLGDIAFDGGRYAEAVLYYQPLVDRPESSLHRAALYKTAWSYLRQGRPKEVLPLFFQLWFPADQEVESGGGSPCKQTPAPEERQEHLRLLALTLDASGGPVRLVDWVGGRSPAEAFSLVSEMATYYDAVGRKKEALPLVQAWVSAYPLYPETPLLHRAMIDFYKESVSVSTPEGIQARISFIENYRPEGAWAKENAPEQVDRVKPLLKEQLRFLLTYFDLEAKKSKRAALYQKALPWYDLFLQIFPTENETGEIRFRYAEILHEIKEAHRSAESYRVSAYIDPPHSLASEAAYREILILERTLPPSDPDLGKGYARFIEAFPSDPRIAQIYLKKAEFAFQQKDYDKSRQFAQAAAKEEGEQGCTKEAQRNCALWIAAQKLIVQGYLNDKAYPEAIGHLERFFTPSDGETVFLPEKEKGALRALFVLSYYQQGEALKQEGKSVNAADSFWGAYRQDDQSELAPLALFEAASLWGAGEEKKKAEEAFFTFTRRYPQSALYHPALLRLASLYEETDRPLAAAQIFEAAGRVENDPVFSIQALGQAISLYEKTAQWEKVYLLSLRWVERARGNRERQIEGIVRGAEAKLKLGEEKTAEKMLSDLVRVSEQEATKRPVKPKEPSFYRAKAHLLLADIEIKRYEQIKLVNPLEKNLQKKKSLFDRLLHIYSQAVDYPSPVLVLAATHRMGEVFEEFSESLLKSERPKNLSPEEREAYDRLLLEQALPYLEKAGEAYRKNIEWAKKAGIESEWVEKSRERFERIYPQDETSTTEGGLFR